MLNEVKHLGEAQRKTSQNAEILPSGQNDMAFLGSALQATDDHRYAVTVGRHELSLSLIPNLTIIISGG